ncbi:MAG: hypothetical protein U0903_17415 [Planctomycetales bacterium]
MNNPGKVVISTGARLHFGFLSHAPEATRQFGGVGLMVDRPGFKLDVELAAQDEIIAGESYRNKLSECLEQYRQNSPAAKSAALRIELVQQIPQHCGFGSGTQLGMSLAQGIALLTGEQQLSAVELAQRIGRGKRSALGIHGFQRGGLLVESGKTSAEGIGTLVSRLECPPSWRFLLVRPRSREGLSGNEEVRAFSRLEPMSEETTGQLCRIVLMELLPAVQNVDFEGCSSALQHFGTLIGQYFAPVQGGIFSDPRMNDVATALMRQGVHGICQSSWGPTLAILCRDDAHALQIQQTIQKLGGETPETQVVAALNSGAALEFPELLAPSLQWDKEDANDVGQ